MAPRIVAFFRSHAEEVILRASRQAKELITRPANVKLFLFRELGIHCALKFSLEMLNATFTPTWPSTESGCNETELCEPPTKAFAPTPTPSEISPLAPT